MRLLFVGRKNGGFIIKTLVRYSRLVIISICAFIFPIISNSYAEVGKSLEEFEQSTFFKTYNLKKGNTFDSENKTYLKYGYNEQNSLEIVLSNGNIIEEENLLSFGGNLPEDVLIKSAAFFLAFIYEATGGKLSFKDSNYALAKAKERGEAEIRISGFRLKIIYSPELFGEKIRMISAYISK